MPKLKAFGKDWNFADDNLVWPFLTEILFSTVPWFIVLIVVFSSTSISTSCENGHLAKAYFITMVCMLSLHMVFNILIMFVSSRGAIVEPERRKHLSKFLYVKLFLYLPSASILTVGIYWAATQESCPVSTERAVLGSAIYGWLNISTVALLILVSFDFTSCFENNSRVSGLQRKNAIRIRNNETLGGYYPRSSMETFNRRNWLACCQALCCCLQDSPATDEALAGVAEIMSGLFKQPLEEMAEYKLALSDIMAGMLLLRKKQGEEVLQQELREITEQGSPDDEPSPALQAIDGYPTPEEWMTVGQARTYMRFAWGSYGWRYYLFKHVITAPCRLFKHCKCCYTCRDNAEQVRSDACCQPNTAAFKDLAEIEDNQLYFAIWENEEINYKPFSVSYYKTSDQEEGAIVISIRGTLSPADAVTDGDASRVWLCDEDNPVGGKAYAHRGIYRAARFMLDGKLLVDSGESGDMQMTTGSPTSTTEEKKLPTVLHILEEACKKESDGRRDLESWPVVVTGHSLGAGLATVMTILLKARFPSRDIRCYAFSPPGWTVSENLSTYCNTYVMSVVCGFDMVPRSGLVTFNRLKKEILEEIVICKKPKYKIMTTSFVRKLTESNNHELSSLLTGSEASEEQLPSFKRSLVAMINDAKETLRKFSDEKLYIAGQILYMKKNLPPKWVCIRCSSNFSCGCKICSDTIEYQPVWARPIHFDEIFIGAFMIGDHCPDTVYDSLDQAYQDGITMPTAQLISKT